MKLLGRFVYKKVFIKNFSLTEAKRFLSWNTDGKKVQNKQRIKSSAKFKIGSFTGRKQIELAEQKKEWFLEKNINLRFAVLWVFPELWLKLIYCESYVYNLKTLKLNWVTRKLKKYYLPWVFHVPLLPCLGIFTVFNVFTLFQPVQFRYASYIALSYKKQLYIFFQINSRFQLNSILEIFKQTTML